jgi:hypothetical protein
MSAHASDSVAGLPPGTVDGASSPNGPGPFVDRFAQDLPRGRVVGSEAAPGVVRRGVDREKVIGVDHGALRVQPLTKPGWARSGIAYGPFRREPGLAFHTLVLNGHNISRTEPLPDGFRARLRRWALGAEAEPPRRRLHRWLRSEQKSYMWRRLRQWVRSGGGLLHWPWLEENLAVGWFPEEAPAQPLRQGCGMAVHAIVPEGGELWAHVGTNSAPTVRGMQNVPVYYTVILREQGAAYYAASPAGAPGTGAFPALRLLAIDAFNTDETLYAGIHQSVLGEIGFRVDTRVYGVQLTRIPELGAWYGSAHGADMLTGDGQLGGASAEVGGAWTASEGRLVRTARGVVGEARDNAALLALPAPAGLIHVLIDSTEHSVDGVGLVFRAVDQRNFWCFDVGSGHAQLSIVEDGRWARHARVAGRHLPPNTVSALQIYDDGEAIRLYVNGALAYGTTLHDTRLHPGTGVGVRIHGAGTGVALRAFEAHPREIHLPALQAFAGPRFPIGERVVAADDFDGPPGDLAGHATTTGGVAWERLLGIGVIETTGGRAARVRATAQQPCPGRTAYAIPWSDTGLADLQVTITPAGRRRGTREKGRAGLIFWQDPDNYLILSAFVEDWPAMSIAAFFQVGGFEELFDAVWSNVGSRMHWGEPHDFRTMFDGTHFAAYINGERVLYRALTDVYAGCKRFEINRVGIVSNWEWGNDTGSTFERFVAKAR